MQQADQTVSPRVAGIDLTTAQDRAETLAVILTALTKLLQPRSAAQDLADHARLIANTLAAEVEDAAESLH